MCGFFDVKDIRVDPWQMHRSVTTLRNKGLPIQEYPQTVANLTSMGQALFDLLNGRNLRLYPSPQLREQALNTVAIESPRGFRIAKEKVSKKIDAIVALAMACAAALEVAGQQPPQVEAPIFEVTPSLWIRDFHPRDFWQAG
jgi:phage terminase large subunit-like protein